MFDTAVDVRHGSETFGSWVGVDLDSEKENTCSGNLCL